ncbi:MAG: RNA 2',3'-cyclic phosphodiesterase [Truepera sp.]|nr:RNA 2',3'-cyclic phosphodiesterase [Truepera sp.]
MASSHLRCFVALTPPPALKQAAAELGRDLYHCFPPHTLRLIPEAQLHLTLLFLGNVNTASLPDLTSQLASACAAHQPFSLSIKGLGVFPNPYRARVLWCGVAGDLAVLTALSEDLCRGLEHQANRDFHLTLGRFQKSLSLRSGQKSLSLRSGQKSLSLRSGKTPPPQTVLVELLNSHAGFMLPAWQVREVELFASELTAKGAIHTRLARWALGQMS